MRALGISPAGEERRNSALTILRDRRSALVRRGQRALLVRLLGGTGTATADDVRAAVELPDLANGEARQRDLWD